MNAIPTPITGVFLVETDCLEDTRGYFYRAFCDRELECQVEKKRIRQANISCTREAGTIRGLHFQFPPHAETKLVRCIKGQVWDVVVDLRADSPTFLRYQAETLSEENARLLTIPPGCAHGFQVLEPESLLLYLHTEEFAPNSEGGLRFDDPLLGIQWPVAPTQISMRDRGHALLTDDFRGLIL